MKFTQVKRAVTGVLAAVLFLFGAWTTATAQKVRVVTPPRVVVVQRPFYFPHYYYPRYYTVVDPIAYQRETGYSDGLSKGKDDAKHGKPFDLNAHKHYRDSDSINYREAFAQGYNDGYRSRMG